MKPIQFLTLIFERKNLNRRWLARREQVAGGSSRARQDVSTTPSDQISSPRIPALYRLALAIAGSLLLNGAVARADTHIWTGNAVNNLWSTPSNWQGLSVPSTNETPPVIVEFPDSGSVVVTNDIPGLVIDRLWLHGSGWTLQGADGVSLTLRNPGDLYINLLSQGTNQIGARLPLILQGTNRVAAPGALTIYSEISGTGGMNITGNLRLDGTFPNTYTGPTVLGSGILTLDKYFQILGNGAGVVSVPGPLEVSYGTIVCSEDDNIADTSPVLIQPNGKLDLNHHNDTVGFLTLKGGEVATGSGVLTLNDDVFADSGVSIIRGNISLGGQNRTFAIDLNDRLDIFAHIHNGAGLNLAGLIKTGLGVLALQTNNSYSGSTAINLGTLELGHAQALGSPLFGATSVGTNATLSLADGVIVVNEPLFIHSGKFYCPGVGAWVGPIALSGNCEAKANSAGDELALTGVLSGSGNFTHTGGGRLLLGGTNSNTYTGTMHVVNGSLWLAKSDGALAVAGDVVIGTGLSSGASLLWLQEAEQIANTATLTIKSPGQAGFNGVIEAIGGLIIDGGQIHTGAGMLKLNGDIAVQASTHPAIISGQLALGNAPRTINVAASETSPALDISAAISGLAGAGLIKTGPGELRFSGNNNYPGVTTVGEGVLKVAHDLALGLGFFSGNGHYTVVSAGAALALEDVDVLTENLSLSGNGTGKGALYTSAGNNSWSGSVQLVADTLINTPLFSSLTLNGPISGTAQLTKTGSGTLTYAGTLPNTLSGVTVVTSGLLSLNKEDNAAAIAGPLTIGDGVPNDTVALASTNQISDSATVVVNSAGVLQLNGQSDTIGALAGWGDVQLGSGHLTVGANHTSTIFHGNISGSAGKFTKIGNGMLTLTGTSTHTGDTIVKDGVLRVDGAIATSQTIATNGATLGGNGQLATTKGHGGVISPGNSVGILNTASLLLNSAGTLSVEIQGPNPGTDYDRINAVGTVSLPGARLTANFTAATGTNTTFTIISNDGLDPVVGTFQGLAQNANFWANSRLFQISYTGGDGNDVVLTQLTTAVYPMILSVEKLLDGSAELIGQGIGFGLYNIQAGHDLVNWQTLDTIAANDAGTVHYIDPLANNQAKRFYRLLSVDDNGQF